MRQSLLKSAISLTGQKSRRLRASQFFIPWVSRHTLGYTLEAGLSKPHIPVAGMAVEDAAVAEAVLQKYLNNQWFKKTQFPATLIHLYFMQ